MYGVLNRHAGIDAYSVSGEHLRLARQFRSAMHAAHNGDPRPLRQWRRDVAANGGVFDDYGRRIKFLDDPAEHKKSERTRKIETERIYDRAGRMRSPYDDDDLEPPMIPACPCGEAHPSAITRQPAPSATEAVRAGIFVRTAGKGRGRTGGALCAPVAAAIIRPKRIIFTAVAIRPRPSISAPTAIRKFIA